MLIPAIDIMSGRAVKLIRGSASSKRTEADALSLARRYSIFPQVNVIDLDAAFGKGDNSALVRKICRICSCNVGGGIRSRDTALSYLKAGAKRLIIGTAASEDFLRSLPRERLVVALDSRKGKVVDKGWTKRTDETPLERAQRLSSSCSGFLYTCVDMEGTMSGIDLPALGQLRRAVPNRIMYAGGISSLEDIRKIAESGADPVVGMALFSGKLNVKDCFAESMDFSKGVIPTIVQDETGQVLMLAYSNKESLSMAIQKKRGIYFSRSRQKLWIKGESSGNTQELLRVKADCDNDSLLFMVRQEGVSCHRGDYSCFDARDFSLGRLYQILFERKKSSAKESYTKQLLEDPGLLKEKIMEEAGEVVNYKNRDNLIWEIADLLYFLNVAMVSKKITYADITRQLEARNAGR